MKTKRQVLALSLPALLMFSACQAQLEASLPGLSGLLAPAKPAATSPAAPAVTTPATPASPATPTETAPSAPLKNAPVKQVQIMSGDTLVINQGDKVEASASVIYEDNTRDSALLWTSSDNTIATVNATTGAISGVKSGIATILARSVKDSSKQAMLTITVKKPDVVEALTRVTPDKATLAVGDTVQLQATILLSDGTLSPNVIWKTSNTAVAVVTNGLVVAAGKGVVTITAVAAGDSTRTASAMITVN
jgi:hypothetical protein